MFLFIIITNINWTGFIYTKIYERKILLSEKNDPR